MAEALARGKAEAKQEAAVELKRQLDAAQAEHKRQLEAAKAEHKQQLGAFADPLCLFIHVTALTDALVTKQRDELQRLAGSRDSELKKQLESKHRAELGEQLSPCCARSFVTCFVQCRRSEAITGGC